MAPRQNIFPDEEGIKTIARVRSTSARRQNIFPDEEWIKTGGDEFNAVHGVARTYSLMKKGLRRSVMAMSKPHRARTYSLMKKGLRPARRDWIPYSRQNIFPDEEGIKTPNPSCSSFSARQNIFPDEEGIKTWAVVGLPLCGPARTYSLMKKGLRLVGKCPGLTRSQNIFPDEEGIKTCCFLRCRGLACQNIFPDEEGIKTCAGNGCVRLAARTYSLMKKGLRLQRQVGFPGQRVPEHIP